MKESTKAYWNLVGKKLKSISKVVLDISVPVAVEAGINKVCGFINKKLHDMYKNTIVNSLITLGLNIVGMLIVLFYPFGAVVSKYIAAIFFGASVIFFGIRLIQYFKEYGKATFDVGKSIVTERSVCKGIENYVYDQFPVVASAYAGINLAANYLPSLKQIPSLNKTIRHVIHVFWKRLAVYGIVVAVYSISVYWIAKPILLKNMTGLAWYEIYFYPVFHIISLIK